uniref:Phosphotyrosine protein phosphatase I domain-containing protein n=1 Tax=Oryctolagus cuniculus TaxID=9986 RepID=A0A5F9DGS1_RABIT
MAQTASKLVLFVCLGNICQSPIAEAVFRKLVTDQNVSDNWKIDSTATSTCEIGNFLLHIPRVHSCILGGTKEKLMESAPFTLADFCLFLEALSLFPPT